jgi:hypothetical protein
MDEDLRYEVSDQIAEISLARPPVNALSLPLLDAATRWGGSGATARPAFLAVDSKRER